MGEQKLAAALAGSKKSKKKKWAKGRVKEKKNNASILLPDEYETAIKEIPRMKTITIATVSEKFRIKGSLSSRLIRKLATDGVLTKVVKSSSGFMLYKKSYKQMKLEEEAKKAAEEAAAEKEREKAEKKAKMEAKKAAKAAKKKSGQ